jgi:hypothetical protein
MKRNDVKECKTIWINSFIRRLMRDCQNILTADNSDQTVSTHFCETSLKNIIFYNCSIFEIFPLSLLEILARPCF